MSRAKSGAMGLQRKGSPRERAERWWLPFALGRGCRPDGSQRDNGQRSLGSRNAGVQRPGYRALRRAGALQVGRAKDPDAAPNAGVQRPGCPALRGAGTLQVEHTQGEPGSSRVRCNALLGTHNPGETTDSRVDAPTDGAVTACVRSRLLQRGWWSATV